VAFALCILGTAVFAKPAVAKIEKVIGLIHTKQRSEVGGQRSETKSILVALRPDL
jgi:hypothetical protein